MTNTKDRSILKGYASGAYESESDQQKGLPQPALERPCDPSLRRMALPPPEQTRLTKPMVIDCFRERVSRRKFLDQPLELNQLSFLLWAAQGVKRVAESKKHTFRTVPSGGARHPFETYLTVNNVKGLEPGRYRYLALSHELAFLGAMPNMAETVSHATCDQTFCGDAPVTFFLAAVPYRMEWRYPDTGLKVILLDAGHAMQNLYLAAESLGLGTCAIAAYSQEESDAIFGLDGRNELIVYVAPVGVPGVSPS